MAEIRELRQRVDREYGRLTAALQQVEAAEQRCTAAEARALAIEEAQRVIQFVAQETQKGVVLRISEIVTAALDAVFEDDAYEFRLEFVQRRGKTEADIFFERNGERVDPLTAAGGGCVDVAAFALRVALWSLLRRSAGIADTLVLDEPFRWLSRDLQPLAGKMLKMLSEKLGVQMIFVTHVQELIESADRVFEVTRRGKISKVEMK